MFPLLTRAYSEGALTLVLPYFWLLLHMHYLVFTHHRLSIYLYAPARIFSVPTFPAYLFGQPFCEPPSHCLSLTQASVPCGHGFFSWQPPLPCRCSVLGIPPDAAACLNIRSEPGCLPHTAALLLARGFLESTWLKWNDGRWKWASWYTFSSSSGWAHHSPCKGLWNRRLRCSPDMWAGL